MTETHLRDLLEQVRSGAQTVEQALARLTVPPMATLGFAHVDLHRQDRCGFPEVIFCEGKANEWVEGVVRALHSAGQDCLATRVSDAQSAHLAQCFPAAEQDRTGRTFWLPVRKESGIGNQKSGSGKQEAKARVEVITAGTADLPVAHEAMNTARAMGCEVELLADVGVAGIHRLLRHSERLKEVDALVVVAGMEGALPSVVGGLVDCPVIAVPTSVGYGASFQGLAALLGMLNSCAANVAVVNIDSGFKGGYVAALIARRAAASIKG
jgi:hypothetical protein